MRDPLTFAMNLGATARRGLAVAILSGAFLLSTGLVALVAQYLAAQHVEIDELRHELGRVTSLVERGRDLQREAEDRGRNIEALFLAGADEAAAASGLQTVVTAVAREIGLDVISSGRTASFDIEGVRMVGVKVDVTGGVSAVYAYLDTLFHRLPNADIRKISVWRQDGGNVPGREAVLVAQIEVFGALPPADSGGSEAR